MQRAFFLFANLSGRNLIRGADGSGIRKEFCKNSKAIWFLRKELFEETRRLRPLFLNLMNNDSI